MGDFNYIRVPKKMMSSEEVDARAMEAFNQFIDEMDMEEYLGRGFYSTWCNQRENGNKIYSKIDRILVNEEWIYLWLVAKAEFLAQ